MRGSTAIRAKVLTLVPEGIDGVPVVIEARWGQTLGFPGLDVQQTLETRLRTRDALASVGVHEAELAGIELLVPLSGRRADLAIAVAGLVAAGRVAQETVEGVAFFGEIHSDGTLTSPRGLLPCLAAAARAGVRRAIVSADGGHEGAMVENVDVLVAHTFGDVARFLEGRGELLAPRTVSIASAPGDTDTDTDANDVAELTRSICSPAVIRALTLAAAGGHPMLLLGGAGSPRGRVARRLTTLLPPIPFAERLEVTSVYSLAGLLRDGVLGERPFRAPHPTVSAAGLVGGGACLRPAEVSLAHAGVLYLAHLDEFRASTVDPLPAILDAGEVTMASPNERVRLPAKAFVVGDVCTDGPLSTAVEGRLRRLALFPRLQIHVTVRAGSASDPPPPSSATLRAQVVAARERQVRRNYGGVLNADLSKAVVCDDAWPDAGGLRLFAEDLSTHKSESESAIVLRLARTIADLAESPLVKQEHVAEALQLRLLRLAR